MTDKEMEAEQSQPESMETEDAPQQTDEVFEKIYFLSFSKT